MAESTGVGVGGDSTRRSTKPGIKRLLLTLSVLLSFLSGLPFLLKSTEIYRSLLPLDSISSLSHRFQSNPPSIPCRFHAVFLRSDRHHPDPSLADRLESLISKEMRGRIGHDDPSCGSCGRNFSVSVTVDSGTGCAQSQNGATDECLWKCGALGFSKLADVGDEVFDELLNSALNRGQDNCLGSGGGRVYTVVVMEEADERDAKFVIGKHRHAWIVGRTDETDAVSKIGKIFVKFFMNGGIVDGEMARGKGEFMPVGSDGSVVLSFSLLHADPNDWVYDWEFEKIGQAMLGPVVQALAPIANISIESQILYHTPKSSISSWDDKLDCYTLSLGDLPFFVNSNEWHLDTSISATGRSKVLQFVVYVPSAWECPLYLRLPDGEASKTNAFISPMWGGVIVWNPPNCSVDDQKTHTAQNTISPQDLQKLIEVFIGQLRLLFGVRPTYVDDNKAEISKFIVSETGFTEWELDMLYRHHACFNLQSCLTTLESLSSLVQSLPRMIVMDEIGKQVKLSLQAANLAEGNASLGINDASAAFFRTGFFACIAGSYQRTETLQEGASKIFGISCLSKHVLVEDSQTVIVILEELGEREVLPCLRFSEVPELHAR
ncbi:uncharacterized protein [Typha latifolia]|uniref:uncharacterized protein isoform X2 n=1 Tax=Typha latifolia TaxID=4733 RepID=UPI003C308A95